MLRSCKIIIDESLALTGERFTPGMAWIDLQILIGGEKKILSFRELATRWKWSKDGVSRFIAKLEKSGLLRHQVRHQVRHLYSLVSECYDNSCDTKCDTTCDTFNDSLFSDDYSASPKNIDESDSVSNQNTLHNAKLLNVLDCKDNTTQLLCVNPTIEKKKDSKEKESRQGEFSPAIEKLYKSYPTKCPISGRSTGKTIKDKARIKNLLKTKTENEILKTIERYVEDCNNTKTYVKNFSTFLNNLPDYGDLEVEEKESAPVDWKTQNQIEYEKAMEFQRKQKESLERYERELEEERIRKCKELGIEP